MENKQLQNAKWKNRIVSYDPSVDPSDLLGHPQNWRRHSGAQREAMTGVLSGIGWTDCVKVSAATGMVLDGHLRCEEAISAGENVPVLYVQLSPAEEALVLATHDTIGMMAFPDSGQLNSLVSDLELGSDPLDSFIAGLISDAKDTEFQDAGSDSSAEGGKKKPNRTPYTDPVVKVAVFLKSGLGVVERAIKAQGSRNRGEALVAICRAFLEREQGIPEALGMEPSGAGDSEPAEAGRELEALLAGSFTNGEAKSPEGASRSQRRRLSL